MNTQTKEPKYMIMFPKDLSVPPGGLTGNTEIKEFSSLLDIVRFVTRSQVARTAIGTGRFRFFQIKNKKK